MDRRPWHTGTGEERIMTLHQLKIEPKWLDRLLEGSPPLMKHVDEWWDGPGEYYDMDFSLRRLVLRMGGGE